MTPAVDEVYVSTDDMEIARCAHEAGAKVIQRPASLADDEASTESAVSHALEAMQEKPEIILLLQCTSPFRRAGQLQGALEHFERSGCDSLLSVVDFRGFVWTREGDQGVHALNYDPNPSTEAPGDPPLLSRDRLLLHLPSLALRTDRCTSRRAISRPLSSPPTMRSTSMSLRTSNSPESARGGSLGPMSHPSDGWCSTWTAPLTDGAMYYGEDGSEFKRFDTRDGLGIRRWKEAGGRVALITGEDSQAAARRAEKLKVDHLVLGCKDKEAALQQLKREQGLSGHAIVAMGDDLNDLPMVPEVGLFVAPSSAQSEVLAQASIVTERSGGHGAVRELIDRLLAAGALVDKERSRRLAPFSFSPSLHTKGGVFISIFFIRMSIRILFRTLKTPLAEACELIRQSSLSFKH